MLDSPHDWPQARKDPTAERNILLAIIVGTLLTGVSAYHLIEQLQQDYAFAYPINTYYSLLGVATLTLIAYGLFLLWLRERRGWVITTGLLVYSLTSPLAFWGAYLLARLGINTSGYGTWDVPQEVLVIMLSYLLGNAVQLFLLVQPGVRERLQVSTTVLTNTVVIGLVAAVANQIINYAIGQLW
jgi:hypothetical protein